MKLRLSICVMAAVSLSGFAEEAVSFNKDVRQLLADNCLSCHGADSGSRKAGLRLDRESAAKSAYDKDGHVAIVAGDVKHSVIMQRMLSKDPDEIMPPPEAKISMTREEIATIGTWIEQGAKWEKHWAFIPPETVQPSQASRQDPWVRNSIDPYILDTLAANKLKPAAEADRATLLRRLSFDLTGLPPTLEELDTFIADTSPDSYETVVDRLLASTAFGERMAVDWLDAARYGDTDGLFGDVSRSISPWRDWVVQAYNQNLPYDEFVRWQLAGDLLPDATMDQKIATGFLRNNVTSFEGGIIDEDYRVKYLVDRVNTTATAFLGLTLECAQCHDHKYDPMSQQEYFQFSGFFNSLIGKGKTRGSAAPTLRVRSEAVQKRIAGIEAQIATLQGQATVDGAAYFSACSTWRDARLQQKWAAVTIKSATSNDGALFVGADGRVSRQAFGKTAKPLVVASSGRRTDTIVLTVGTSPISALRIYPLEVGDADEANFMLSKVKMQVRTKAGAHPKAKGKKKKVPKPKAVTFELARAPRSNVDFPADDAIKGADLSVDGWSPPFPLVATDHLMLRLAAPLKLLPSQELVLTIQQANGNMLPLLNAYRLEVGSAAQAAGFADISAEAYEALYASERDVSKLPGLLAHYRDYFPANLPLTKKIAPLKRQIKTLDKGALVTMIAGEGPMRNSYILERGEYDKPGKEVTPAALPSIMAYGDDLPKSRLGLAAWMTDPKNPLTARVAVNHLWQRIFGVGIVKTSEDFGSQGSLPSHPELLNALSVDFVQGGWDVKRLVRLIVTSATYRQSGIRSEESIAMDSANRLLSYYPRGRLQAEFLRDHALMASNRLVRKMGGQGVVPYQPKVTYGGKGEKQGRVAPAKGLDLYRRSIYTYLRRQVPPANMRLLGADGRTLCRVRRERTNTPLQALVVLNDPQFTEAARLIAVRVMKAVAAPEDRLAMAFRITTSRLPNQAEAEVLYAELQDRLQEFKAKPEAAKAYLTPGQSAPPKDLAPAELAAYSAVASLILNLDESISKN